MYNIYTFKHQLQTSLSEQEVSSLEVSKFPKMYNKYIYQLGFQQQKWQWQLRNDWSWPGGGVILLDSEDALKVQVLPGVKRKSSYRSPAYIQIR